MILSRLADRALAFTNSYEFPFNNPNTRNTHLTIPKSQFTSILNHPSSLRFKPAKKWHRIKATDKPGTKEKQQQQQNQDEDDEEDQFHLLTAIKSNYNDIAIVDTPKSLVLLLDSTHNIHSIISKGDDLWTSSYWDDFASLPPIIPSHQTPIAVFGLGGGTAAHLLLSSWPSLKLQGWEIDEILIDKAREFMGLSRLEKPNDQGGVLDIRIGDVLSQEASFPGGYSGIVVDLFANGKVLPELEAAETWLSFRDRLVPSGGRIMVNCGGVSNKEYEGIRDYENTKLWELNDAIRAMFKAFPGELCWKKTPENEGDNYLALTGPLPDFELWSQSVPDRLKESVKKWRLCT